MAKNKAKRQTLNQTTAQIPEPESGSFSWRGVAYLAAFTSVLLLAGIGTVVACYRSVPLQNTELTHFDTLLVLGSPANDDGTPSYSQRWLVEEAARQLQAGVAGHVILSGGAVANRYPEAEIMGGYARALGISSDLISEDARSQNTLQNVLYCRAIMQAHGWRSVEVIGLAEHLPRTAVLLQQTNLLWRMRAAATPGRSASDRRRHTITEAVATTILRLFGLHTVPVLHWLRLKLQLS
jgi:vancomycin permeability regulator SanA